MIQSRKRNDPPPRPVTFTAAEDLNPFELAELWADRMARPVNGSGTSQLLADPALLAAKLREEAEELAQAQSAEDVVRETADVFYMALVALVRGGGTLTDVRAELARRHGAVSRRPMARKTPAC